LKKNLKRKIDLLVLSDIHLGTYGCHAEELIKYLQSVKPKTIVLNGDIIDGWNFSKNYFPPSHLQVISELMNFLTNGTKIIYLPGNHDEFARKFSGRKMGNLIIDNKAVLDLNGEKVWIFHGDVFDISMKQSKWLAKIGGVGYDWLILTNRLINKLLVKFGKERISISKKIKSSVKSAIRYISDFEDTAINLAIQQNYDVVICGHIHQPCDRMIENQLGKIRYLNSGDWIENLTSLEYNEGAWHLYHFHQDQLLHNKQLIIEKLPFLKNKEIFHNLTQEFQLQ
jgi:UDP-2,3-diacylglucosamine pyrophosphatase LpxH